jgi:pilus assembly protein CpaB
VNSSGISSTDPYKRVRRFLRRHRRGVAAALAGVAVLAVIQTLSGGGTPVVSVAVASIDLPAGHTLTESDVTVIDYPRDLDPPGTSPDASVLVGEMLVSAISAGEPVTASRLLGARPQAGRGKVAAPVRLADAGVAGLLAPGDVITIVSAGTDGTASVLARNARIITRPIPPAGLSTRSGSLVLVAVNPNEAATLAAESVSRDLTAVLQ